MTARAGTLTWDIDVGRADEAQRKIDDLSRRLDAALNKPRGNAQSTFTTVSQAAATATGKVQQYTNQFQKLKAEHELGQRSTVEYRNALTVLQTELQATARATDSNTQEYRQLATTMGQTQRELDRLTREQDRAQKSAERLTREQQRVADTEIRDRVRSMVNEVRLLRNEWQETGQNTEQTKERFFELRGEMAHLRQELNQSEGGWEKYNREITQLAVAGRSAEATVAGMEGRVSRLGLASQVSLGATDALRRELGRFGPAGQVAGQGLGIVSKEMQILMELGPEKVLSTITGGMLRLAGAATLVGGALAVGLSVALFKATERAAEYARELENATFRTGLTVEGLQELQHAARSTGVPMELLSTTMQRLQRRAADANGGNKGLKDSFDALGVSLTDTNGEMRSTEDLLGQVADGLNRVENNADRLALAFKIFDTEGGRLLPLLSLGSDGIRELREEARELGLVISGDTILSLSEFHAEVETLKQQFETARIEITAGFLPVARDILVPILQNSVIPWMQGAAQAVDNFSDAFFDTTEAGAAFRADTIKNLDAVVLLGKGVVAAAAAVWGSVNAILGVGAAAYGAGQGVANWDANSERILERRADLIEQIGMMEQQLQEDWAAPGTEASVIISRNLQAARDELAKLPANWREAVEAGMHEAAGGLMDSATASFDAAMGAITFNAEDALERWAQGMGPRMDRPGRSIGTNLGDGVAGGLGESLRTVDDIFEELAAKGSQVREAVTALGGGLDDELWGLQQRARLVDSAINELLARPDVNQGDTPDRLSYLLNRAVELETQIGRVQTQLNNLNAPRGGIAGLPDDPLTIGGFTLPGEIDAAEEARRKAMLANWQAAQAAVDAYAASLADLELRLDLGLVQPQDEANERLKATQAVINALVPMWGTLTEGQKAYVRASIQDVRDLEAEIARAERAVEDTERRAQAAANRQASLQDERPTVSQADIDALYERQAAQVAQRREAILAGLEEAARRSGERQATRDQVRDLGAEVTTALRDGALDGLNDLEQQLVTILEGMGDDPSAAPFMGLLTLVRSGLRELEAAAIEEVRRLAANVPRAATAELEREVLTLTRRANIAIRDGTLDGLRELERVIVERLNELGDSPEAAPLMGLLVRVRGAITESTNAAAESVESLQWKLVALRNQGAEPTSAAVQELVRRINELQLRAALDELRTKGAANLSEFAKRVLELNGIIPTGTTETKRFSDALRTLGVGAADGLADVLDGIRRIGEAGGDAEEIIAGLTQALEGAQKVIDAIGSGDTYELIKGAAMMIGEGIGQAMGVPGVGGAVGAVFDLGRSIVQAISDAFTGDSPAARAIREGLTPAVQSAFTNGILAALQGGDDWQKALRENLQLAFLTSLINAFVQTAIVQAVFAPIFTEYSKMVARGQFDAAAEFLSSSLPGAIETGIRLAEDFVSSVPHGLIPTPSQQPGGGGASNDPRGFFELPTAAISGIAAPDWARDLVNAGRIQLEAATEFREAVAILQSEGILIRTEPGASGSTGGAAAAARAV
ncbi:MAG: hypothetical protein WDA03_08325 [Trueperaceae bacterium]